VARWCNG